MNVLNFFKRNFNIFWKTWMAVPLCIFWTIAFNDQETSVHRMKTSSLCNLWSWTNLFIVDRPGSLFDFLVMMGCRWGLVGCSWGLVSWVFGFSLFLSVPPSFDALLYVLGCRLGCFLSLFFFSNTNNQMFIFWMVKKAVKQHLTIGQEFSCWIVRLNPELRYETTFIHLN